MTAFPVRNSVRAVFTFILLSLLVATVAQAEAKSLQVSDIYGKSHTLFKPGDSLGTVLIFVLQDCPISNGYVPEINRLAARYTNFSFYLVHVDMDLNIAAARKHSEDYKIKPAVLRDPDHRLVKLAGAKITPEAAVFSSDGQRVYLGRIDDTYLAPMKRRLNTTKFDLREALDAMIAGKPVVNQKTQAIGCYISEFKNEKSSDR